jgi:tRNA-2-methylthio-N6-dimethylallyladenosine synthase
MRKIYLETFGCQMNVLDSELVQNQLTHLGYSFTPESDAADVVLYNTCSVRELAEQKVLSRLGRLKQRKQLEPSLVVGVIGCMAERDGPAMLKRLPFVDLLCGPSELDKLPGLLENVLLTGKQQQALAGNTSRRSKTLQAGEADGLELLDLSRSFSPIENKYQAYIRVVRGCNKFCTYCVVPYTRGPEVSRSPDAIIEEARKLVAAGALEITLLGQTVNHYVHEEAGAISTPTGPAPRRTTFAELLARLHDALPDLPRLRFITSFPADFGDDILHAIARSPRICRYLHIPAQSGSNRILKLMNRGYTVETYRDLLERAQRIVPDIRFASDFIVGFPTETDEDYDATRQLVAWAKYRNSFIFKYSPRPGTVSIKRFKDDVPDHVKRARNNDLLALQNAVTEEANKEVVGRVVDVLCTGPSGWKQPTKDSHVAASSNERPVVLGASLARGLTRGQLPAGSAAHSDSDAVQLTGRTTLDQIVVFDGPVHLEGSIVRVRIGSAHAMTAFGTLESGDNLRNLGEIGNISPAQSR